jgi:hypothetical protein
LRDFIDGSLAEDAVWRRACQWPGSPTPSSLSGAAEMVCGVGARRAYRPGPEGE